jgi:hypothetical protein
MSHLGLRTCAGLAFTGFVTSLLLPLFVVIGYRVNLLASAGWAGGEYAGAFVAVAMGVLFTGCVVLASSWPSPWRLFWVGAIAGAALTLLAVVATVAWF